MSLLQTLSQQIPALLTLTLIGLMAPTSARAIFLADILFQEDIATDFSSVNPSVPIPSGHLADVEFNTPGVGVFFNSGPWYISGSPRAYGFFEPGTTTIDFLEPMDTVTLAARGSAASDVLGPFAAPPATASEPLDAATGSVEAVGMTGAVLASVPIQNFSLVSQSVADLITFDAAILGEPIFGINLVNAAPAQAQRSLVVIGAIGVTVPEPQIAGMLSVGSLLAFGLAKRRERVVSAPTRDR